jgi:amino acid permease
VKSSTRADKMHSPGVALFTVFAALAGYSGYLLWMCFMGLDSYEYPVKSFGDLGFRLYGRWARYLFNILQGIQLILNVGTLIVSNGEALSQAAKFKLCFAVCCLVWALVGFFLGQVRTLQKFGWLANGAVWMNIIVIGITMGAAATTAPNYLGVASSAGAGLNNGTSVTPDPATGVFPGVTHSGGLPDTSSFVGTLNGAMSAVFSYGGSMIFPEFMSEMKRPRDFLKASNPQWIGVHSG